MPARDDPHPPTDVLPLSLEQAALIAPHMLRHWQLPLRLRIGQAIDPKILARALTFVADRHEPLRLRLVAGAPGGPAATGGVPLGQRFAPPGGRVPLDVHKARPGAEAERILDEAAGAAMDLYGAGPLRATLARYPDGDCDLQLVVHHLASDNWSQGILAAELDAAYRALAAGRRPILPALRTTWTRHVWAQHSAGTELTERQWDYWSAEVSPSQSLSVPARYARQRPARVNPLDWAVSRAADGLSTAGAAIDRYARATRVTPAVVWQTILLLAMSRAFEADDFVYYYMHHGRDLRGSESLVGFFARSVVLRFRAGTGPAGGGGPDGAGALAAACRDTLRSVAAGVTASGPPFRITRLSDRLEAEPGFATGRLAHPLSRVTVNVQLGPGTAGSLTRPPFVVRKSRLWFWLSIGEPPELLAYFDRRAFPESLIGAVFGHVRALVRTLAAGPDRQAAVTVPSQKAPMTERMVP